MMELIKQKLFIWISLILVIISFGCNTKKKPINKPIMECIIDNLIPSFEDSKYKILHIKEVKNWSDSTNIIIITDSRDTDVIDKGTFVGTYKDVTIYFKYGKPGPNNSYIPLKDIDNAISNNISWERVDKSYDFSREKQDNSVSKFANIQLVYYTEKDCIKNILYNTYLTKTESNLLNCYSCN